jgi:hypothetical protein
MAEEMRFPKCRICNYRYFCRLDLCRHFVDNHLRERLSAQLDKRSTACPVCHVKLENHQARLRHFAWNHQNLEDIVLEQFQMRLSEFPYSTRDLRLKELLSGARATDGEDSHFKELTDLAELPADDSVDVECSKPSCELCGEKFQFGGNNARLKGVHLLRHFREEILQRVTNKQPFTCSMCKFTGRDFMDVCSHYGLSHKIVFKLMKKELGAKRSLGEVEDNNSNTRKPKLTKIVSTKAKNKSAVKAGSVARGTAMVKSKNEVKIGSVPCDTAKIYRNSRIGKALVETVQSLLSSEDLCSDVAHDILVYFDLAVRKYMAEVARQRRGIVRIEADDVVAFRHLDREWKLLLGQVRVYTMAERQADLTNGKSIEVRSRG